MIAPPTTRCGAFPAGTRRLDVPRVAPTAREALRHLTANLRQTSRLPDPLRWVPRKRRARRDPLVATVAANPEPVVDGTELAFDLVADAGLFGHFAHGGLGVTLAWFDASFGETPGAPSRGVDEAHLEAVDVGRADVDRLGAGRWVAHRGEAGLAGSRLHHAVALSGKVQVDEIGDVGLVVDHHDRAAFHGAIVARATRGARHASVSGV